MEGRVSWPLKREEENSTDRCQWKAADIRLLYRGSVMSFKERRETAKTTRTGTSRMRSLCWSSGARRREKRTGHVTPGGKGRRFALWQGRREEHRRRESFGQFYWEGGKAGIDPGGKSIPAEGRQDETVGWEDRVFLLKRRQRRVCGTDREKKIGTSAPRGREGHAVEDPGTISALE